MFGTQDKQEIKLNHDNMKTPWDLQSGFQVFKAHFTEASVFATFASQPIPTTNILNMFLTKILANSVFQLKYTEWYALPNPDKFIVNTWSWWAKKVMLKIKVSKVARNMVCGIDYGLNTSNNTTKELNDIIEDFAPSHRDLRNCPRT